MFATAPESVEKVYTGAPNEYLSIWHDVGGTFTNLASEFDGVQKTGSRTAFYWSWSEYTLFPTIAWVFNTDSGDKGVPGAVQRRPTL